MKLIGRDLSGFAKTLVVLVTLLLVSAGLCGLQMQFANAVYNDRYGLLIIAGLVELAAMILSAVGIVLMLILWGARTLYRVGKKRTDVGE